MKIVVECAWCAIKFLKWKAWAKRTPRHFCTRECSDADRSMRKRSDSKLAEDMAKVRSYRSEPTYAYGRKKGYKHEKSGPIHRVIAAAMLGRPIRSNEVVHHKDGDQLNNDPSNLDVMSWNEHSSLHLKAYYADPINRLMHSIKARNWWANATHEQREARCQSMRKGKASKENHVASK